ncbi:MAG: CRTAC1 family protein [Planctomycetota bacterium]
MRTDPEGQSSETEEEVWDESDLTVYTIQKAKADDGEGLPFRSIPFSGRERNRLFMNEGDNFHEHTLVSGADFREDGRGFALFDYDNDGFLDFAIANPNSPKLRIVRNRMADLAQSTAGNSFVRIKLIGGHKEKEATEQWSPRSPYGAKVTASTGKLKRIFQYNASEGLSAQNGRYIHIGMGKLKQIDELEIQWPSGKISHLKALQAGQTTVVYENPAESE